MRDGDVGGRRMVVAKAGPRIFDQSERMIDVARRTMHLRSNGEQGGPEDRRRREVLVERETLLEIVHADFRVPVRDLCCSLEDERQCSPDGVVVHVRQPS